MLARAMAPPSCGPYFLGSAFSLVDVALAPFWQRFVIVGGHYRGLAFPDDPEFHRLQVRSKHLNLLVHNCFTQFDLAHRSTGLCFVSTHCFQIHSPCTCTHGVYSHSKEKHELNHCCRDGGWQ